MTSHPKRPGYCVAIIDSVHGEIEMEEQNYFDAIVVGAGIIGSSTAYHLVKNGQKTLILEQVLMLYNRSMFLVCFH